MATRHVDTPVRYATAEEMWRGFDAVTSRIREGNYAPTRVFDGGNAVEYAFCPLTQYTAPAEVIPYDTASILSP